MVETERTWKLLIGGRPADPVSGAGYRTENPATGAPLADVPDAGADDVRAAVAAAERGQPAWAALAPRDRARALRRLAVVLAEHAEEIATLDALDCGHPRTAMLGDVAMAVDALDMYADWALRLGGDTIPSTPDRLHVTVRQPYGVVARIVPYNHPAMFAATKIAAPLLAGNAVVLKAPPQAPLSALRLGELFAEHLPEGVLSVLSGRGAETGEALVRHPAVRRIALIGSVRTGQDVLRAAAETGIKDVTLELGGKNAMIVFPDADLDAAAAAAVRGMNFHWSAGQSCGSTSRLLLHESIGPDFLDRVRRLTEDIRVGDPMAPDTEMGALVTADHLDTVRFYIDTAREQGADVLTGAERPDGERFARGHWLRPTVLVGVRPEHRVAREEIFGPVLSVLRYRDEDEAVRIANALPYGLTGSVWTRDLTTALRVAHRLETGYVWVNEVSRHFAGTPFGGWKDSGLGREESIEDLLSYTQLKSVHLPLS
ncbi:aldehyde dehydrogenase family protein [Actinomadura meridiana]|uniref:Aldehyde dehydrogenase family protein n=2 Tax=Actinomadura meridiana TaxID=559626 RepID=A0ABP8C9S9_9ACTN